MGCPVVRWARSGSTLACKLPRQFGERTRTGARRTRLRARRRAIDDASGDALQDCREAEQVVGQVEVPVGEQRARVGAARAFAIPADVVAFRRNAERGVVEAADAAE